MTLSKEELIEKIEAGRKLLDQSIDEKQDYEKIYAYSVALDKWIEQYIVAGY